LKREGLLGNVAGAVLVGGASTRMGSDKSQRAFAGVPAATRISRLLAAHFEDVLLVGGDPPADAVGRRVLDVEGPRCALRGVVTSLAAARAERVLVVATDLPLLTPALLLALVAWPAADVVLPRSDAGHLEPLCAIWSREVALVAAREQLAADRLALHELVARLDARTLEGPDLAAADPGSVALSNANSPAEWSRLESLLPWGRS
jgi:molybdopterin-guanine dinucleotide biosynthesis protein A